MTKQTYWMADVDGAKALVTGADERDRWTVHGWKPTTEPARGDLVWLEHDVTQGRQLFAAAAAGQWAELGWTPCAPPEPVDLTKDPQFTDPAPEPVAFADAPPVRSTRVRAASGDEKE